MAQNEEYGFPTSESSAEQAARAARGNGSDSGEQSASDAMQASLSAAKQKLSETMAMAQDRSRQMMNVTSDYIQRWPLGAVAVAVGVGLVLGVLIGRSTGNQSLTSRRGNWM